MHPSTFCAALPAHTYSKTSCGFFEIPAVIVAIPVLLFPEPPQGERGQRVGSFTAAVRQSESARRYGDDLTLWSYFCEATSPGSLGVNGEVVPHFCRRSSWRTSRQLQGERKPLSFWEQEVSLRLETAGKWVVSYHYLDREREKNLSHQLPEGNSLK